MTGEIAKAITLTTFGNVFLKNDYDISKLTLEHPSFNFTNKVEFLFYKKHLFGKPTWHQYADNPIEWLKKLKQNGCKEIRMVYQSDNSTELNGEKILDHKLAGFVGGGGNRFIQTVFENHSDFWQSKEEVTDRDSPSRKIWTVSYGRILIEQKTEDKREYDIEDIKDKLKDKLTNICAFAKKEKLSFWAEWFNKAISLLDSRNPYETEFDKQIVPEEMDIKIKQLLAGAGKAWCFGGMGSWNDIGFTDKEKNELYDRLTSELYEIVNESYIAIVNS